MTKDKLVYIMTRLMREEMPLMTEIKCKKVARKLIGILEQYETLKPLEEPSVSTESTPISKKS